MVWITNMTLSDLDKLEEVFAKLTEQGWITPDWITWARNELST